MLTVKSSEWFPVYVKLSPYTGDYQIIDDGDGNWRVKFLTSGTFTAVSDLLIDVFAVGGGGASGYNKTDETNGLKYAVENKGGGGGGTNNIKAPNFPKIDLGGSGIVVIRNTRS